MAIILFSEDSQKTYHDLPWVEEYYEKLKGAKKDKFLELYHVVESGVEASSKGWVLNCAEFKVWVWNSDSSVLNKALSQAVEKECALVVRLTHTTKGKFKPILAIDDEIPSLIKKNDEKSFHTFRF